LDSTVNISRSEDDITIVDLIGLGAQDLAIAMLVWKNLNQIGID